MSYVISDLKTLAKVTVSSTPDAQRNSVMNWKLDCFGHILNKNDEYCKENEMMNAEYEKWKPCNQGAKIETLGRQNERNIRWLKIIQSMSGNFQENCIKAWLILFKMYGLKLQYFFESMNPIN